MRNEWKHRTRATTVYGLFMLALSIPSALSASEPDIVPMPADTTGVKPEHLANNCSWMDMPRSLYERCVRVAAAQMSPLDPAKREHFGEQYSPRKYLACRLANDMRDTQCERYRLRRSENPEYWPNPNMPKPKWPEAPKQQVYKPGMSGKEYFEALCKAEAGEFIYKTVENVEGIYQIRPRKQEGDYAMEDRYVMEDPYGYTDREATDPQAIFVNPPWGNYKYFETAEPNNGNAPRFLKYSGYNHKVKKQMQVENVTQLNSRYGFTWRGIQRPHDRELGIVGGELIVVDLRTNEILGIRRGFIRSGTVRNNKTGIWWLSGYVCPKYTVRPGWPKDGDFAYWLITQVLKPMKTNTELKGDAK